MLKYKVVTVKEVLDNVIKHLVSDLLLIIHHDITNSVWESVRNLWLGDNSIWLSWNIRNTTVHVKLLSLIPHLEFTGQLQLRYVELLSRQLPGLPDPVRWLLLAQQGRRRAGDVTSFHTTRSSIVNQVKRIECWPRMLSLWPDDAVTTECYHDIQVGDMKVYRTGGGPKCVIWCYDIYGFEVRVLATSFLT